MYGDLSRNMRCFIVYNLFFLGLLSSCDTNPSKITEFEVGNASVDEEALVCKAGEETWKMYEFDHFNCSFPKKPAFGVINSLDIYSDDSETLHNLNYYSRVEANNKDGEVVYSVQHFPDKFDPKLLLDDRHMRFYLNRLIKKEVREKRGKRIGKTEFNTHQGYLCASYVLRTKPSERYIFEQNKVIQTLDNRFVISIKYDENSKSCFDEHDFFESFNLNVKPLKK